MAASMRRQPPQWSTPARGFSSPARRFSGNGTGRRQWKRYVPLFRPGLHEVYGGNLRMIRFAMIAVTAVSFAACRHANQQRTPVRSGVDREMLKLTKDQI